MAIRKHRVLLAFALFLMLAATYLFLWTLAAAKLSFVQCPEGYSIVAPQSACRLPAVLQWLAFATTAASILVLAAAVRIRKRAAAPPGP